MEHAINKHKALAECRIFAGVAASAGNEAAERQILVAAFLIADTDAPEEIRFWYLGAGRIMEQALGIN